MGTCIVGWAHPPFGCFDQLDIEALITGVMREAIAHAAVPADAIDATGLGNLNGGFIPEIFCASLAVGNDVSVLERAR